MFGLVTYSPRQSKTSFAASREEMKKCGVEFELLRFSKRRHGFTRRLYEDFRIIIFLLTRRLDFVILNSGAALMARPGLLLLLVRIAEYRRIPAFVLWRNAFSKFAKIEARIGSKAYCKVVRKLALSQQIELLSISPQTSHDISRAVGVSKVHCIGNCQKIPAEYDLPKLPDDPPIVLNVANVLDQKGPDLFIKVAAAVCECDKRVKFVWVGGEARPQEIDLIEEYGLRGRVEFRAYIPSPYDWMVKSSIFLFPSRSEGFGLVAAEAMACYRTVCCFEGTGTQYAVGDTGVVMPAFDIEVAAREICRLLQLPPAQLVNRQARERYETMFSPRAYAGRLSELIKNHI